MKGFALDENGDLLIENNQIGMVNGDSLLQQHVLAVLRTNLGEWFFDWDQGIDFDNLTGKNTNEELVRYEIEKGLKQVDETFVITELSYEADLAKRKAVVHFKAQTETGDEVGGGITWD